MEIEEALELCRKRLPQFDWEIKEWRDSFSELIGWVVRDGKRQHLVAKIRMEDGLWYCEDAYGEFEVYNADKFFENLRVV